jgi:hypothetical protein
VARFPFLLGVLDGGVNADAGALVAAVGQAGQAECGGAVEGGQRAGAGGVDVGDRTGLGRPRPQREAAGEHERSCEMITTDQAERIATEFIGAPADDPGKGWDLREFPEGWLIIEKRDETLMGAPSYVIERATGRVTSFPSYVPPDCILEEYDQVVADGLPAEHA